MDMIAMRPSEWRKLSQTVMSEELAQEIVRALEKALWRFELDQGFGVEEAFETSVEIANAGLWDKLSPDALAALFVTLHNDLVSAVLEAVPEQPRSSILRKMGQFRRDRVDAPTDQADLWNLNDQPSGRAAS